MVRPVLVLASALAVSSCDWLGGEFFQRGSTITMPYDASIDRGEGPRDVTVEVEAGPDVALADFRESARYPVTRYCIETFGISKADWVIDPATGDWAVTRTEDGAILQARCEGR